MKTDFLSLYLKQLQSSIDKSDAREESFYGHLQDLLLAYAELAQYKGIDVTILPKATEAGNPDFRVWNGKHRITGYIEAKAPHVFQLDPIAVSEQLKRYLNVFPNLILTNFYEFRLYQYGKLVCQATIASSSNALSLHQTPPLQKPEELIYLLERYFAFSLPAITTPKDLAVELAKRTRFLRDEVVAIEIAEEQKQGKKVLLGFYDSFKKLLINNLTHEQFADLYAQTLTYGIFAARTKATGEFNRELIYKYIPSTLGVLKSIFKFISYEEPPVALEVLIDDIAEVLCVTDIQKILHTFYQEGKGNDPIIHFYETFLSEYDPALREKRGVYYTPEPVVRYIVKAIHSILQTHFALCDGLADSSVTLLDPAAGTLTFPAEAIKTAIAEYTAKYGTGSTQQLIKSHILPHFYALELMMAPYTVGHLKISYLLSEFGYQMAEDERFKLYLSNTLEHDTPPQSEISLLHEITDECELANQVKQHEPVLVIMGNPPYSGSSENNNAWTEQLLKTDIDGATSYFSVDGKPLGEKNPKWLQDDYVKFLRFTQWKIHKAGKGIVGMITNHGYLDNPTFRGMRQSLLNTFDEIYVLDLHGNSKKKEKCPDGSKDENVFDIQQGTAIILMIKTGKQSNIIKHTELFGLRNLKYEWLETTAFDPNSFNDVNPTSPFYLFHPEATGNEHYLDWKSLPDIFPVNSVGIVTARDALTIQDTKDKVRNVIHHFASLEPEMARQTYNLGKDTRDWKVELAQNDLKDSKLDDSSIVPIMYRPFDKRFTYYTGKSRGFQCMPRYDVMKHMLQENIGIVYVRQVAEGIFNHAVVTNAIIESRVTLSNKGISYLSPLYLYPDDHKDDIFATSERSFNIAPEVIAGFTTLWGDQFAPLDLFYYVYAILYSSSYRTRYAQYLRMDFPRIPFTTDRSVFMQMAALGKTLTELHLLRSAELATPLAKYQGSGNNDMVSQVVYDATSRRVHINPDKYFEGIEPAVWNYHIGGYQVLHKYLKDRKDKVLSDPIHYCRIVTALSKTIQYQAQIDAIYPQVENTVEQHSDAAKKID